MTIVAVANRKGGVGKTTITVHLAAYLAGLGLRVLVLDGDPQANATAWLSDGEEQFSALWRLLIAGKGPAQVVVSSKWGVGLLPGAGATGDALTIMAAQRRPFQEISQVLQDLVQWIRPHVLFLDMPPSKAAGFCELLFAADYLLAPTQAERLSLQGVQYMARTVAELRARYRRSPRLLGVIPNMVRARTVEHGEHLTDLVRKFGPAVWPAVPLSIRMSEAATYGTTVWERDARCSAAKAMSLVCKRFVENTGIG